ncbi:MAG: hypothetical protein CVU39_21160 [Chloroflexi bacterium HGW-Chloroflexi-10]|nr:MAG: hypothetical protein CVU39_21160 [Chloroflexi bacterium HGW-Chloroflexi-10]
MSFFKRVIRPNLKKLYEEKDDKKLSQQQFTPNIPPLAEDTVLPVLNSVSPPINPPAPTRSIQPTSPILQPAQSLHKTDQSKFNHWKTVYVFISSTFNDMHAERDYLVKQVFPELREWCEQRKLHLVDIDLRWGVTEQDATQNRRVVEVCLERIDQCRPFFISFLGQRRGWVPLSEDVSDSTLFKYPGLKDHLGATSVTEMEILHALINPMCQAEERVKFAFFYLRDPGYLTDIPAEPYQLKKIYTNDNIADIEERSIADQALTEWKEKRIQNAHCVRQYKGVWNPQAATPELAYPLTSPSLNPFNLERWQIQWQQLGVQTKDNYVSPESLEVAKKFNQSLISGRLTDFECEQQPLRQVILEDLKQAISEQYPDHVEVVFDSALQREIDQQELFTQTASEVFIPREGDFDALDAYVHTPSTQLFALTANAGMGKTTLVASWVNHLREQTAANAPIIIFRFIGASDDSTSIGSLLSSVSNEIKNYRKNIQTVIPADPQKIRQVFPKLLEEAGRGGKMILVLDALNQLESGLSDLNWLPLALPAGIKVVVTFKRNDPSAEDLYRQWKESGQVLFETVKSFEMDDRHKLVQTYLSQYLKQLDEILLGELIRLPGAENPLYLKILLSEMRVFGVFGELREKISRGFGENPVSAFRSVLHRLETDPTYSNIEPLRAVPVLFGALSHARHGLSVSDLVEIMLRDQHLEHDPKNCMGVQDTVNLFLRQVRPFLSRRNGRYDFFYESFKLAALERYTSNGDGNPNRTSINWHTLLADYFYSLETWQDFKSKFPNARKTAELPYHLGMAEKGEQIKQVLTDFDFLEAKITASQIYELVLDYERIGASRLKISAPIRTAQTYKDKNWIICPFCGIQALVPQQFLGEESACPTCNGQIKLNPFVVQRAWKTQPAATMTHALQKKSSFILEDEALIQFADFIRNNADLLCIYPTIILQHALDEPNVSFLHNIAFEIINQKDTPHIKWLTKPQEVSACIKTVYFEGYDYIGSPCLSPDGKFVYLYVWSGDKGGLVVIHNLMNHSTQQTQIRSKFSGFCSLSQSGNLLAVGFRANKNSLALYSTKPLKEIGSTGEFPGNFSICVLSPNGDFLATGCDGSLTLWDTDDLKSLFYYDDFIGGVVTCAFSPNGSLLAAGSDPSVFANTQPNRDNPNARVFQIINTNSGKCLFKLNAVESYTVKSCAFSPDGALFFLAIREDFKYYLHGYSTSTFELVFKSDQFTSQPDNLCFSPDGKWLVVSHFRYVSIYQLNPILQINTFLAHTAWPIHCCFSMDGKNLITTNKDGTLKIWEMDKFISREEDIQDLNTQEKPVLYVKSCVFSPDQAQIIAGGSSASNKSFISAWDVSSGTQLTEIFNSHHLDEYAIASPKNSFIGLFSKSSDAVVLFHYPSLEYFQHIKHGSRLRGCSFLPDGKKVITYGPGGLINLWDVNTKVPIYSINAIQSDETNHSSLTVPADKDDQLAIIAISPDESYFVAWSKDLIFYDLLNGKEIRRLPLPGEDRFVPGQPVIYFSQDGLRIALSDSNRKCRLINLSNWTITDIQLARDIKFSPDGRKILIKTEGKLQIFAVNDLSQKNFEKNGNVTWVEFSPDGIYLVVFLIEKRIRSFYHICEIWDIHTGNVVARKSTELFKSTQVAFPPAKPYLAMGGDNSVWYLLQFMNIPWGLPITTAIYRFYPESQTFENKPSVICKWCGEKYFLEDKISKQLHIISTSQESEEFASAELLTIDCPTCHQSMRINPILSGFRVI